MNTKASQENILKSDQKNIIIYLLYLNYLLDFTGYFRFILIDLFSYYINS
jgi:hypothetical protein